MCAWVVLHPQHLPPALASISIGSSFLAAERCRAATMPRLANVSARSARAAALASLMASRASRAGGRQATPAPTSHLAPTPAPAPAADGRDSPGDRAPHSDLQR